MALIISKELELTEQEVLLVIQNAIANSNQVIEGRLDSVENKQEREEMREEVRLNRLVYNGLKSDNT